MKRWKGTEVEKYNAEEATEKKKSERKWKNSLSNKSETLELS